MCETAIFHIIWHNLDNSGAGKKDMIRITTMSQMFGF